MNNTTPLTPDDKVYAALSYLFVLSLLPLLLKRQSDFVQWHARQGFLLFIAEVVVMMISPIPLLGWIVGFVGWLAAVVLSLLGLAAALTGKYWVMPYLGEYAKKLKI